LQEHKLFAKHSKCEVCALSGIDFLGYRISAQGVATQPNQVAAVTRWPVPSCQRDVRAFLSLVNFCRRWIKSCASIAAPLQQLLRKDQPFTWEPQHDAAFLELKRAVTTAPVLAIADPRAGYHVTTDASDFAIGAVLAQETDDGVRPIAVESRKLIGPSASIRRTRKSS
jgi:hypothetical protein